MSQLHKIVSVYSEKSKAIKIDGIHITQMSMVELQCLVAFLVDKLNSIRKFDKLVQTIILLMFALWFTKDVLKLW